MSKKWFVSYIREEDKEALCPRNQIVDEHPLIWETEWSKSHYGATVWLMWWKELTEEDIKAGKEAGVIG